MLLHGGSWQPRVRRRPARAPRRPADRASGFVTWNVEYRRDRRRRRRTRTPLLDVAAGASTGSRGKASPRASPTRSCCSATPPADTSRAWAASRTRRDPRRCATGAGPRSDLARRHPRPDRAAATTRRWPAPSTASSAAAPPTCRSATPSPTLPGWSRRPARCGPCTPTTTQLVPAEQSARLRRRARKAAGGEAEQVDGPRRPLHRRRPGLLSFPTIEKLITEASPDRHRSAVHRRHGSTEEPARSASRRGLPQASDCQRTGKAVLATWPAALGRPDRPPRVRRTRPGESSTTTRSMSQSTGTVTCVPRQELSYIASSDSTRGCSGTWSTSPSL